MSDGPRCNVSRDYADHLEAIIRSHESNIKYLQKKLDIAIEALRKIKDEMCAGTECSQMMYQDWADEALKELGVRE